MKISEIGEFGLINRISKDTVINPKNILLGIGDDCAAYYTSPNKIVLATCDMLVENIHFTLSTCSPRQLGRKAVAVNISDIAAMGGIPCQVLLSLGIASSTSVEFIDQLANGMKEEAKLFEANIIGGDTVRSSLGLVINITLIGEVEPDLIVKRSTAKPGDLIMVTGELGGSAAGLILLLEEKKYSSVPLNIAEEVKSVHLSPVPRIKEGRIIARERLANSMIDISDGLASDLTRICETSAVGAKVYASKIPILSAAKEVGGLIKRSPLDLALYGGEDYELLFTVSPQKADNIIESLKKELNAKVSVIGEIREGQEGIKLEDLQGKVSDLQPKGYNHFRR
ncbi:MAG: thiamine-phosphate kinase [Candidatus Caldatribacteriota bacterium]|nr:thiamine-phosphate kinase [Candidatus Caldatribacteriota bacterium]